MNPRTTSGPMLLAAALGCMYFTSGCAEPIKTPILCSGSSCGSASDAGPPDDAALPISPDAAVSLPADAAPPSPADGGVAPGGACNAVGPITLDSALPAIDYGRVFIAEIPAVGVFTVANHKEADGLVHAQIYQFAAAQPSSVTKVNNSAATALDLKVFGTTFVLLTIDASFVLHTLAYDATQVGQPGFAPVDTVIGASGACALVTGSLYGVAAADYMIAATGTACGLQVPWLGVGRTGKGVKAIAVHAELMPANPNYPLDAMILMSDSFYAKSPGEFLLMAGPNYLGFTALGGMSGYLYGIDAQQLTGATPVKVLLGTPNDLLSPLAIGKGPNLAVKAMTPTSGMPIPLAYVGPPSLATPVLSGQSAPQQTMVSTAFASVDAALMWNVSANWFADDLLATSVSLGAAGSTGANLYWWNAAGTVRGRAAGVTAIGKPTAFKAVAAAFKSAAAPNGHIWVAGSAANSASQGRVVVYDVTCP